MIVKQIKLSSQAKERLSRLREKRELKIGMFYVDGHFAIR